MKAKSVNKKIKGMVHLMGGGDKGRDALAKMLYITRRYVYYLENGRVPGYRLYRDVCNLSDQLLPPNQ